MQLRRRKLKTISRSQSAEAQVQVPARTWPAPSLAALSGTCRLNAPVATWANSHEVDVQTFDFRQIFRQSLTIH
jgi:hypothetical protein